MMPPLITVGSIPPASSIAAIIDVVVVLPCVPATAIVFCMRISSASISARRTTRQAPFSTAASISGIAALDRGRADHDRGVAEIVGAMADRHRDAGLAQPLDDVVLGDVRALHLVAELVHHLGDARHADAADADEMDRADVGAQRLHHAGTPIAGRRAERRARSAQADRRPATARRRSARPGRRGRAPRSAGRPTASARRHWPAPAGRRPSPRSAGPAPPA